MRRDSRSSGGRSRRLLALLSVGATATALVLLTPAPAAAEDTDLAVNVGNSLNLERPNDTDVLSIQVQNNGPESVSAELRVRVPLDDVELDGASAACEGDGGDVRCVLRRVRANQGGQVRLRFQAPDEIDEPRRETGSVEISVRDGNDTNGGNNQAQFEAVLGNGADQPSAGDGPIDGVSGKVTDRKSKKPIDNAKVVLTDTAGNRRQTLSEPTGEFTWDSKAGVELVAGVVTITVSADGYGETKTSVLVAAGQRAEKVEVALTGSPGASASAKPSAQPAQASSGDKDKASEDDSGGFSPLSAVLITGMILGTLGALAIVIWLWRSSKRRDGEADDDLDRPDDFPASAPAMATAMAPPTVPAAVAQPAPPPTVAAADGWNGTMPTQDLSGAAPTAQMGSAPPAPAAPPAPMATAAMGSVPSAPAPPTVAAPAAPAPTAPPPPTPPTAPLAPGGASVTPTAVTPSVPVDAPAAPPPAPSVTAYGATPLAPGGSSVQPSWPAPPPGSPESSPPRHARFSDQAAANGTGTEPRHARSDQADDGFSLWAPRRDPAGGGQEWPDHSDPATIRSSDTQQWQPTFDAEGDGAAGTASDSRSPEPDLDPVAIRSSDTQGWQPNFDADAGSPARADR